MQDTTEYYRCDKCGNDVVCSESIAHQSTCSGPPALSDSDALDRITDVLSGQEWSADTPEQIAEIVKITGRTIRDLPEYEGDAAE